MTAARSAVHARLRRYPALGFLAVAALLASLLPSALRVPLSGPSASAELAPVPGKSDSAHGDLAALGETSTGGLGGSEGTGAFGRGGLSRLDGIAGGQDDAASPPPGGGRNPMQKRCVGNPPRQTEDPLSPPCVAYFKGDNFGSTAKGVTAEEITLVWPGSLDTCDRTASRSRYFDYDSDDPAEDPAVAAYVKYFNERFQLYGRRVHVHGSQIPCSGETEAARLQEIEERYKPFAVRTVENASTALEAARLGTMTFFDFGEPKRDVTVRGAPYVLSFRPDHDDLMASAGEFVCARLAGRIARFAGDPALRTQKRKFGIAYNYYVDNTGEGAGWLMDAVRHRCGDAAGEIVVGHTTPRGAVDGRDRMRAAGVTTVITVGLPGRYATEAGVWQPEWLIVDTPGNSAIGDNHYGRLQWSFPGTSAFGIASSRRLAEPARQQHRLAFAEGCACTDPPPPGALTKYENLLLLFTGIQAAGPRLTPANVDRGLHAIAPHRSRDPYAPAAYFAPGNYSFFKDWSVMWWDAAGQPPGSNNVGCWRLVEDGLRYRAEDWQTRPGDDGIQGQGQPCQGDS